MLYQGFWNLGAELDLDLGRKTSSLQGPRAVRGEKVTKQAARGRRDKE